MSDNVVNFPRLPKSGTEAECMACGATTFRLLAATDQGVDGVICAQCGWQGVLTTPTYIQPLDAV